MCAKSNEGKPGASRAAELLRTGTLPPWVVQLLRIVLPLVLARIWG